MARGGGRGRRALVLLGALAAAALMLYGGSAMLRRDELPAAADWTGWDGTVVFLGDSITEFCDLEHYYPGLRTVNKGIAGDTTGGMLERVDADVCALSPSVAVVHGGINDIFMGVSDDTVVENLQAIVSHIREALPETQIIVQSVYPVEEFSDLEITGHVRAVNERLAAQAKQNGYTYVDVYSALAAEDGRLTHGYADDGLHPNDAGYTAVQPVLAQAIREAVARYERANGGAGFS